MNTELDWFLYVLDPHLLYENIGNISDEGLVKLIRMLLFHAERHEIRNMNTVGNGERGSNGILIAYDKAKTFDRLALMIATHFRFSSNIFSSIVSEIPLTLTMRTYRSLISSVLRRDDQVSRDIVWLNSAIFDIDTWNGLSPSLAYSALIYHLWILQVVILNNMIPQPSRNQTPSVCGLSELPDGSFLSSNTNLRKDIYKSHLISVQRLHDLLLRLTIDRQNQPLLFTRPTITDFFQNITKADRQDAFLPNNAIISSIAFVLGRLAFQKNLIQRANELFKLAKEKMAEEQLEYIEEVGATSQLVDAYLTCCQQLSIPSRNSEFLMDSFCALLYQNLSPEVFKFDLRLTSAQSSLPRNAFSFNDIIMSLDSALSDSKLCFGFRTSLWRLMNKVRNLLSVDSESKIDISQLRRDSNSWRSLYAKEFVNNGVYWIRKSALAHKVAFCDHLLSNMDNEISFTDFFADLCHCVEDEVEVSNFMKQLLDLIILNLTSKKSAIRAAQFVKSFEVSSMNTPLPVDALTVLRNKLEGKSARSSSSIDGLFADLPDVGLKVKSFPSPFSQQVAPVTTFELGRCIRDVSYLMSSDPEVVLRACKDLLMIGTSVETIFRSGGWLDTALPIFLKWSTRDPQVKHRRDAAFIGNYSLPYDFLAAISENVNCTPSLLLLLRAIEYRRDRMQFDVAKAFLSLSERNQPAIEMKQDISFSGGGGVPFWRRSLLRWICEMIEEEKTVLGILDAITATFTLRKIPPKDVLLQKCKCILMDDIGPDRIISDDLLACAACYLLIKESRFILEYEGRLFIPTLISQLLNLSTEKPNFTKSACNLCSNFLQPWLKSTWDKSLPYFQNAPSFSSSIGPQSVCNLGLLTFTIRLLAYKNFTEGHAVLDRLINCLATFMRNTRKIEPTADYNPTKAIKKRPFSQEVADLLQFSLACGLESDANNTNYLVNQANFQSAIQPNNPRLAMTLILQAAAIESNYFSQRVPSSLFTPQTLETMILGCQSMGYLGEALVLCQFEGKIHIPTGLRILESAAKAPSNFGTYNSLESMTVFFWDLQLLEALCKFQQCNQAFSKKISFLRCINQVEVNAANAKKSHKMAIWKRQTEFLRYLSLKLVSV